MTEELQHAAKNFREQLTAGINGDIGALVLLVHPHGLGCNTNIAKPFLAKALRALLEKVESGHADDVIVPANGSLYRGGMS